MREGKLEHGQAFVVRWRARNRAELSTVVHSVVVTVDVTPPVIAYVNDFGLGSNEVDIVGSTELEYEVHA